MNNRIPANHHSNIFVFFVILICAVGAVLLIKGIFNFIPFIKNKVGSKVSPILEGFHSDILMSKNSKQIRIIEKKFLSYVGYQMFYPQDMKNYVNEIKNEIEGKLNHMDRISRNKKVI